MPQAIQAIETRTALPTSDTFWKLVKKDIALSLLTAWTGRPLEGKVSKDAIHDQLQKENVSIDWARIARWLKNQAGEPDPTPPEGVKAREWAFDREFYLNCRGDKIDVVKLKFKLRKLELVVPLPRQEDIRN